MALKLTLMQILMDLNLLNDRIDECIAHFESKPEKTRSKYDDDILESLRETKKMNEASIEFQQSIAIAI